jgi:hypothetical protein
MSATTRKTRMGGSNGECNATLRAFAAHYSAPPRAGKGAILPLWAPRLRVLLFADAATISGRASIDS